MWCLRSQPPPPSLQAILDDDSDGQFSRTRFTEFLRKQHCLEPLDFVLDADSYCTAYLNSSDPMNSGHLIDVWQTMVANYLRHDSPRELNIASDVRVQLLEGSETNGGLPSPSQLIPAVEMAKELMKENGYLSFVQEQMARSGPRFPTTCRSTPSCTPTTSSKVSHHPCTAALASLVRPLTRFLRLRRLLMRPDKHPGNSPDPLSSDESFGKRDKTPLHTKIVAPPASLCTTTCSKLCFSRRSSHRHSQGPLENDIQVQVVEER